MMTKDQINRARVIAAANCTEFSTASELAEFIADVLNIDDELDDETSELWDIAISAICK